MQLTDLKINERLKVSEFKATLASFDNNLILLNSEAGKTSKMLSKLIEVEKEFLLVDESILSAAIMVSIFNHDKGTLEKLDSLANLDSKTKNELVTAYLYKERFKHGYYFDREEYLDLVCLENMLLQEKEATSIDNSPYVLYAANYLKYTYKDYYEENIAASYYLYIMLLDLENNKDLPDNTLFQLKNCLQSFEENKDKEKIMTRIRKRS